MPLRKAKKKAAPAPAAPSTAKRGVHPKLRQWRWHILILALLMLSFLVLFLAWLKLFNVVGIEDYVQYQMISHLATQLEKRFDVKDISIIWVDENTQPTPPSGKVESGHRKYHAELIEGLSQLARKWWFLICGLLEILPRTRT